jgi:hypothetical protein
LARRPQPDADHLVDAHVVPLVEGKRRELDRRDVCLGGPTGQGPTRPRSNRPLGVVTGRHFITSAAELLAGLRLWAQRQYRSDQAVRELLEAVDPVRLREIAAELQAASDADATAITGMAELPSGHLLAIASYAMRAL